MNTVKVEVTLPADVYSFLSVRAAIDDLRPGEGIARLLEELARRAMQRKRITGSG